MPNNYNIIQTAKTKLIERDPESIAYFNGEDFSNLNLRKLCFNATEAGKNLQHRFKSCKFNNSHIYGSEFNNCNFIDCQFNNATLFGVIFNNCVFINCDFSGSQMQDLTCKVVDETKNSCVFSNCIFDNINIINNVNRITNSYRRNYK